MTQTKEVLFSPFKLGPVTLRNRVIRAAAFEGMCKDNAPTEELQNYHQALALGGVGMTTVAYASVDRSGLSFSHQLWLRDEALPSLKKLTESVHQAGAACSIQIGHTGNMAKRSVTGSRAMAPSTHLNWYGPNFPRSMNDSDIHGMIRAFGQATRLARNAGFDAVEVHAGHGYLISQFLSPHSNRRKDQFGGSFENRSRFLRLVIAEVKKAAGNDMAILVKMNMRDGFRGGMEVEESLQVARILEEAGINALVLSGGFVSKAPMYILRGSMPIKTLSEHTDSPMTRALIKIFGEYMIKGRKYEETYFLRDALTFRSQLKLPLVYVGGLVSRDKIDEVLTQGFEMVAIARALIKDTDFVNKLQDEGLKHSSCDACNHCVALTYDSSVACIQNENNNPTRC